MAATEEEEDELVRHVALQNAEAILQARVRAEQELLKTKEALEDEKRVLELLNRTGAALASNLDLQSLVQAVTDAGVQLSGAQFGAFFYTVKNAEGGLLNLYTLSGAPREAFAKFGHPRATPVFGPTFRGEAVVRSADIRLDPRYGKNPPFHGMPAGHLPVASYLAVPVISRSGAVSGGLFFGHSEPDVFTERAERLIVGIAGHAAIAIDNAQLYEAAQRASAERAQLLEAERAARLEVERANVIKDEFLATLSHELRTPLSAVLGWSQLLLGQSEKGSKQHTALEKIVRNTRVQARLIEDLLDMNQIVSGKMRLEAQAVDLPPVMEAALDSVMPSAEAKGIAVRRSIDPELAPLNGDPSRLQQVVWNLLSNAVKFTPSGGTIDVTVRSHDSQAEIRVQDSGVGIRPGFMPHIFERFRQADASTTRRYGGLGLGLSIAKQLVELHGGTINAESEGDGLGATFIVRLPHRKRAEKQLPPDQSKGSGVHAVDLSRASLAGTRVLVIDDERDARELVRALLLEVGADVCVADSADEGLRILKSMLPRIIVSDVGMPAKDGFEFMAEVRRLSSEEGGGTPAIALSAFARPKDRERALLAGYQLHLPKPIDAQALIQAIHSVLGTGSSSTSEH